MSEKLKIKEERNPEKAALLFNLRYERRQFTTVLLKESEKSNKRL